MKSTSQKVAGTFHVPSAASHGTWNVPASAPLKAFEQKGASPFQGNVTALNPKEVTAFP